MPASASERTISYSILRIMCISMLKLKNSSFYIGKRWWTMNSSPSSTPALTALIACVSLFSHNPTRLLTSCQSLLHVHLIMIIESCPIGYLRTNNVMNVLICNFQFLSHLSTSKRWKSTKSVQFYLLEGIIKGSGYNFLFKTRYVTPCNLQYSHAKSEQVKTSKLVK